MSLTRVTSRFATFALHLTASRICFNDADPECDSRRLVDETSTDRFHIRHCESRRHPRVQSVRGRAKRAMNSENAAR